MNRPSLLALVRALHADKRLHDPQRPGDRSACRVAKICASAYSWHASFCPRRHLHAALVAEVDELPGLSAASRAAALGVIASAFYPPETTEKETTP